MSRLEIKQNIGKADWREFTDNIYRVISEIVATP